MIGPDDKYVLWQLKNMRDPEADAIAATVGGITLDGHWKFNSGGLPKHMTHGTTILSGMSILKQGWANPSTTGDLLQN